MKEGNMLNTILLWIISLKFVATSSVIWRCPDFNLLQCKEVPSDCRSIRMIYIRHGDMECPGCLICADPLLNIPWPSPRPPANQEENITEESSDKSAIKISRRKRKRMKEKNRKRRERQKIKKERKRERKLEKRRRKKLRKLEKRQRKQKKSNEIMPLDLVT